MIASGLAALVRPWNILIPAWACLLGSMLFEPDIADAVCFAVAAVGLLLALATQAFAHSRRYEMSVLGSPLKLVVYGLAALIAGLSLRNSFVLFWEFTDYPVSTYISALADRITVLCAFVPALIVFARGWPSYLAVLFALTAGGEFWRFEELFRVVWWGQPFADQIPHLFGNAYYYLPNAIAFIAGLSGLALMGVFGLTHKNPSTASST